MKVSNFLVSAAMAAISTASPAEIERRATPKVYLAGDSTMALGGGGSGTQGEHPLPLNQSPIFAYQILIFIRLGSVLLILHQEHRHRQQSNRWPIRSFLY